MATDAHWPALSGRRSYCPACRRTFSSLSAFDRHRTGPMTERHCLTEAEMRADGMIVNRRGDWSGEAMPMRPVFAGGERPNSGDRHRGATRHRGKAIAAEIGHSESPTLREAVRVVRVPQ